MTSKPSVGASNLNIDGLLGCCVCNTACRVKDLPCCWVTSCKKWGEWGVPDARLGLECVARSNGRAPDAPHSPQSYQINQLMKEGAHHG